MVSLTPDEIRHLKTRFETLGVAAAHTQTWSRRSYAPMLLYEPELASARRAIEAAWPRYVTTFDVLFEATKRVDVHVDYESLGPFDVPSPWWAMRDAHFLTVHFNLTEDGGALETCPSPVWLSWVYYHVIVYLASTAPCTGGSMPSVDRTSASPPPRTPTSRAWATPFPMCTSTP